MTNPLLNVHLGIAVLFEDNMFKDIIVNFHGTKQIVGNNLKDCCSMMDFVWKPSVKTVFPCISTFPVCEEANAKRSYSR